MPGLDLRNVGVAQGDPVDTTPTAGEILRLGTSEITRGLLAFWADGKLELHGRRILLRTVEGAGASFCLTFVNL